jgi:hypothetical protein
MEQIKIIGMPKIGNKSRYEAREGREIFDISNRKTSDGWKWHCTCGNPGCRHIQAAKGVHFKKMKGC